MKKLIAAVAVIVGLAIIVLGIRSSFRKLQLAIEDSEEEGAAVDPFEDPGPWYDTYDNQ